MWQAAHPQAVPSSEVLRRMPRAWLAGGAAAAAAATGAVGNEAGRLVAADSCAEDGPEIERAGTATRAGLAAA